LLLEVSERGAPPRLIARTLDDAAGEAFDKGARLLGLGYPGGPALERLARGGDAGAFAFPTGRTEDFSFAGLKTALLYKVRELEPLSEEQRADLAASYQAAIVEALCRRTERALASTGLTRLAVGGGVAANGPLRERLLTLGVQLNLPPISLCTDNAAMIASAARFAPRIPFPEYLSLDAYASGEGPLR
jgi:N6-L-threonylcarbamoyladenine synthase